MSTITTTDGAVIFYKDWGPKDARPLVFHHGWPLSADDWDNQMMFFVEKGHRVIAHDRRGHGRSSQTGEGHTMDTYAADVGQLAAALGLKGAVHIGHSAGGGEVARYVAHAEAGRVAKAVLISAVIPIMVRSEANPEGLPIAVFDGFRKSIIDNRAQFYRDVPAGPFYGFNRAGAAVSKGLVHNWWRQGMMGAAKAHYDCVKALSETDFSAESEIDRRARPGPARRGRSDRADRRILPQGHQAAEARDAQDLSRLSARHVSDPPRPGERGPAGLHPGLVGIQA